MKVDINPEQFAASIAQAVLAALTQASTPFIDKYASDSVSEVKRKRGRPRKAVVNNDDNFSAQPAEGGESVEEILSFVPPLPHKPILNTIAAKRVVNNTDGIVHNSLEPKPVNISGRKIKFVDDKCVSSDNPSLYANLPERNVRPPAVQADFVCEICRQSFKAYWSEMASALHKERIPGVGEGKPLVRCDNCQGK